MFEGHEYTDEEVAEMLDIFNDLVRQAPHKVQERGAAHTLGYLLLFMVNDTVDYVINTMEAE